ncbi:MAG: hypothetical protein K1X83_03250 [Oligoflexia bacterium]|nr:hypothetical protein [Oligoflexia bacterium]
MRMVKCSSERGSAIVLMLGLVLPVLCVLLALSLQLGTFSADRAREESVVRQAALLGVKFLPDNAAASDAVRRYIAQYSPGFQALSAELQPAAIESVFASGQLRVTLQLPARMPLGIPADLTPALKYTAKASITPRDVAIFLDSSNYMAPPEGGEEFWVKHIQYGVLNLFAATTELSESQQWPAADYFRARHDLRNQPVRQLVYSQQCFNPSFSAFKEAALLLFDKISAADLNSVAVLSGPDAGGGVFELHALGPSGFHDFDGAGAIENHNYANVKDSECLSAAETAFFGNGIDGGLSSWFQRPPGAHWELPPAPLRYGFPANSVDLSQTLPLAPARNSNERLTDPDSGVLLPNAARYLSAREAIWSRRVNPSRAIDIGTVLAAVGGRLLAADRRAERRRELTPFITSSGYILLGDFPRHGSAKFPAAAVQSELRHSLRELDHSAAAAEKHLALYLVITRHEGMLPAAVCPTLECAEFLDQFTALQDFLTDLQTNLSNLTITPIRAPDVSTVALDLMSYLPLTERGIILAN